MRFLSVTQILESYLVHGFSKSNAIQWEKSPNTRLDTVSEVICRKETSMYIPLQLLGVPFVFSLSSLSCWVGIPAHLQIMQQKVCLVFHTTSSTKDGNFSLAEVLWKM